MFRSTFSVLFLLFVEICFFLLNVVPCDSGESNKLLSYTNGENRTNNLYLRERKEENLSTLIRQQKLTGKFWEKI